MVFLQTFNNLKRNCYLKCVKFFQCIHCKKTMSRLPCGSLDQNYFPLQKSISFDTFLMHPSNQSCFIPGPPRNCENPVTNSFELLPCNNGVSSEFYQYENYNYYSYWQNHIEANTPSLRPHNSHFFNINACQSRSYSKRSHSTGNIPKSNAEEVQEALNLLRSRVWETVERPKKDKPKRGFVFSVMSYNVLAQDLLSQHPALYRRHNPAALRWETRWKNLYQEIKCLKPDVICFQEVQKSHLDTYVEKLKQIGYKGVYKKRTGPTVDGCAIFYRVELLNLDECETVEYFQPDVSVLNRNNVAIIAKFVPKLYPKKPFVVATTHLLYNPRRQDVRVAQTQILLAEIERISFKNTTKKKTPYLPIIITGDFNAEPTSAVYSLITKGVLKYEHLSSKGLVDGEGLSPQGKCLVPQKLAVTDRCQHAKLVKKRNAKEKMTRSQEIALTELRNSDREVEEVNCDEIEIDQPEKVFCTGTLSHKFAFKSVYTHGEPDNCEATTYQNRWVTVDYIFYSGKRVEEDVKEHKLKLVSRYKLPLKADCGKVKIPNSLLGSDHLCLMSKFRLKVD